MTAKTKGILVIGNTSELDTADKKRSFELFRKGLNQIDIITYDELLERANHIVGTTTPELSSEGCSGAPYGNPVLPMAIHHRTKLIIPICHSKKN